MFYVASHVRIQIIFLQNTNSRRILGSMKLSTTLCCAKYSCIKSKTLFICYSIDLLYSNTKYLEVLSVPSMISPGESKQVEFRFYPREATSYCEKVGFMLNGLSVTHVVVYGQGTEMKVSCFKLL